jgi:predicted nucleic acid-binding protein
LLVAQERSEEVTGLLRADPEMVVWWGTVVECHSALQRLVREGELASEDAVESIRVLRALGDSWHEIQPGDDMRQRATRLLAVHSLRAADSLQLSAALTWRPRTDHEAAFVCLDERLSEAARREGFALAV